MPTLTFTSGNDSYTVTGIDSYTINFLAGEDTLDVRGGTFTTANMGDSNDRIYLRNGDADIYGDGGADRFDVYGSGFEAHGGPGDDLFYLRGGSNLSLFGDAASDRFNFLDGASGLLLHGGFGDDDFFGYGHEVSGTIYGDADADYFVLFSNPLGAVILRGGTGNDVYRHHAGTSATFLELPDQGIDSVQVARGMNYTLPDNIERISVSGFSGSSGGLAVLFGNGLNNTLTAHNNPDVLGGFAGDDRLFGKGDDDTLGGGAGNDYLDGGPGNDSLHGEADNDTLQGRAGDDTMHGGFGNDTYYVDSLGDTVTENAGEGTDTVRPSVNFTLPINVEDSIVFGAVGIVNHGNELANQMTGGPGNDSLYGLDGSDTLRGGAGNDELNGGLAGDTLQGGTGNDTYHFVGAGDVVQESADGGTDLVWAVVDSYTLPEHVENGTVGVLGAINFWLYGNAGDNELLGSSGSERLLGYAGNDTLTGGGGNDILWGGEGNDTVIGGTGIDSLLGEGGADTLTGGGGNDTFRFASFGSDYQSTPAAPDIITDFETGADVLNLQAVDADALVVGDQAFVLNNSQAPNGTAGDLWYVFDGAFVVFYGDVNGDSVADFSLEVDPVTSIFASDIVF